MPKPHQIVILGMILQKTSDLNYVPKRIISLVPSQTELLHYFELDIETAGITKFCVHPATWFKTKASVGGTKTINIDKLLKLQPDLIIANKEENVKEQIEELALTYPVWLTDVNNFDDALQMIEDIGTLAAKKEMAQKLVIEIMREFSNLPKINRPLNTAYLIWQKPFMTVGGDTFINDMLQKCGLQNMFSGKTRYPETSIAELKASGCELLLLSSEPYPFKQKHLNDLQLQLPKVQILLVDGEMFSWYGSRLLPAASYFRQLIPQMQS